VRQDVRDVGDMVEKFTATPPCRGNPPAAGSSSSEWGPPLDRPTSEAAFASQAGATRSRHWRALTLGIDTGTVQRVLMEQPRPFDVDVVEAAYASQ